MFGYFAWKSETSFSIAGFRVPMVIASSKVMVTGPVGTASSVPEPPFLAEEPEPEAAFGVEVPPPAQAVADKARAARPAAAVMRLRMGVQVSRFRGVGGGAVRWGRRERCCSDSDSDERVRLAAGRGAAPDEREEDGDGEQDHGQDR